MTLTRHTCGVVLLLLLGAVRLAAQTGTIVTYQLDVFDIGVDPNGAGTPLWTMTLPASAVTCNQPPLPAPTRLTALNPQTVYWTDAAAVGKVCKATTVLLGTLPAATPGAYVLTVTVTDDRGWTSPRSPTSGPFNSTPPLAVTGVGVR